MPASWIAQSLRAQSTVPDRFAGPGSAMGYLWWVLEEQGGFAALGYLNTNLLVFPSLRLAIFRSQSKPSGNDDYLARALARIGQIGASSLYP